LWWSALGSVPDKVAFAATNANSNPKWKCQPYAIKAINPKQVQRKKTELNDELKNF